MKALFLAIATSVFLFALWSSNASAQGGYQAGGIVRVYGGQQLGSRIVFRIDSTFGGVARGNIPSCSIYNDEWALDLTTDSGRLAYGVIQDALHQRAYLQVYGTGTCEIMGDREDVRFLYACYLGSPYGTNLCSP